MKLKKLFAVLVSVAMIAALLPMMTFTASASVVRFYLPEGTYALSGALTERSVASDFRAGEIGEGTAGGNEAMPSLNWLDIVREAEEINDIGKGELLTIKFDYEFIFEVEYCEHDCTHIDGKWSANPANSDPCPHPGHEDFQNIPGSTSAKVNEHMAAMAECEHVHNAYYSIIFNYNTDCGTIPHSGWPFKVEEAKSSSTKGTFSQDLTEYFDDSISNLQWIGAMDIGIQITSTRGEGLAGKSIPATLIITNAFIEYRDSSTPAATCTPCTTAGCGKCVDANCTAEGHDPCPGHNACIPCAVSGCGKCIVTNCT
ncbi:MAG: hypothetical protein FWE60_05925, partial [Oscillospiraceae bacterium]|nr:hypothetical protein [Oscillospiraceae bacterium]